MIGKVFFFGLESFIGARKHIYFTNYAILQRTTNVN